MLDLCLCRAGRDHGSSQLHSLPLHSQMSCGFNCHHPCFTDWPRNPGVESAMKQPPELPSNPCWQAAGKLPVPGSARSGEGKLSGCPQQSWPRSCPPREGAQHIPVITVKQSILRESIPVLLVQTASLHSAGADGSSFNHSAARDVHSAARDVHSARAKCCVGTEWLRVPSGGLAGTWSSCFLSTHVRSK